MTDIEQSAVSLTKLLRSKDTTTDQVYSIVDQFQDIQFYFPNKEIFVLELILDRWNDKNRVDFKRDYKVWKMFNTMWVAINDELTLKKAFRRLKVSSLLLQTVALSDLNLANFLPVLSQTCSLINSITAVDITFEDACKILAGVLNLVCKAPKSEITQECRDELINQLIVLTALEHTSEISTNIATVFCNTLLLPIISYISWVHDSEPSTWASTRKLAHFLGKFLFADGIDTTKVLGNFFKDDLPCISPEVAVTMFRVFISFLSKHHFKELETIYGLITNAQPSVGEALLKELTRAKKTLSQEFLENLFQSTLASYKDSGKYDTSFWSLIKDILDLDIEVGISNFDTIMELVKSNIDKNTNSNKVIEVWAALITCFVNGREFLNFLEKWQGYCEQDSKTKLSIFLTNTEVTREISREIPSLSETQLLESVNSIVDTIVSDPENEVAVLVLKVYLSGLERVPVSSLSELKLGLSKIFDVDNNKNANLWAIKHILMELYDDIVPIHETEQLTEEYINGLLATSGEHSQDLFFYLFKLREYVDFDFTLVAESFMEYFKTVEASSKHSILETLFTVFYSLINALFRKEFMEELVQELLSDSCVDLLPVLLEDDDFIEERDIMSVIVAHLVASDSETHRTYLTKIPLQCINKNVRNELIDKICGKDHVSELDLEVLQHMLKIPTFKTKVEGSFEVLYRIHSDTVKILCEDSYIMDDSVFRVVWDNYMLHSQEVASQKFIESITAHIVENMKKTEFDIVTFEMAVEMIKSTNFDGSFDFKHVFIDRILSWLEVNKYEDNGKLYSWLFYCLCTACQNTTCDDGELERIQSAIGTLMESVDNNVSALNCELVDGIFMLHSLLQSNNLEYLFAQYLLVRDRCLHKENLLRAIGNSIDRSLEKGNDKFNRGFAVSVMSLRESAASDMYSGILELCQVQLEKITRENVVGSHLFVKFISEFYSNMDIFSEERSLVLSVISTIQSLQILKPWLFTQYCTEMLLPMTLKICYLFLKDDCNNDDIFTNCTKIISNLLLVHRIKLSYRHHLINTLLCNYFEIVFDSRKYNLTGVSAKALSRLITNLCEPTNVSGATPTNERNSNVLSSKIALIKRSVRKYLPMVLIKFIKLSISTTLDGTIRKELTPGIYSILDLLSQNELSMVSGMLDNAGKQYFRSFYGEYRRVGKWQED